MTTHSIRFTITVALSICVPAATFAQQQPVFRTVVRKSGDDGVKSYRIPGLATSNKGTLLAVYDIRYNGGADLPADIDVGLQRSTDKGTTWQPMQKILDFDAKVPGSKGNGVGDPSILVDKKTGTLFVAALWSQGNHGWHGSGPGLKPEETGQFVLTKSTDDGLTWSPPINITSQVKQPEWRLCFQGPGNGISLKDGTLVFPAQFKGADNVPHSCFIASKDGGTTWKISPAAAPNQPPTSESCIVQTSDGSLLTSMRNESHAGQRVWARWEWKDDLMTGKWGQPWLAITDPTCMASMIQLPGDKLIFTNPNHPKNRQNLTARLSSDQGKTWTDGWSLEPGGAMYSALTALPDGQIGVLYESNGLTFARFSLKE
jgi:sialidase-1